MFVTECLHNKCLNCQPCVQFIFSPGCESDMILSVMTQVLCKQGHYIKMCLKRNHQRVHQIVISPGYDGQGIYLGEDHTADDSEETPNVFLGTSHSKKPDTIHSVTNYAKRIYTVVTLNDQFKMKLKVDTGADICVVKTDDLQDFPFHADIKEDNSLLEGATSLKVAFRDRSINTKFNIVYAPEKPAVIGCAQAQQLGIITVNIDDIESKAGADMNNSTDELQSKAGADVNKSQIIYSSKQELI